MIPEHPTHPLSAGDTPSTGMPLHGALAAVHPSLVHEGDMQRPSFPPGTTPGAAIGMFRSNFDSLSSADHVMAALFGYANPEEMLASPAMPSRLFVDPRRFRQSLRRAKLGDPPVDTREKFQRKDGSTFEAHLRLRIVQASPATPAYYEGLIFEVPSATPIAAETAKHPVHDAGLTRVAVRPEIAKPRLLIVDDHPILRKGIRETLSLSHYVDVVGEAATGTEAVGTAMEIQPDIILMDIHLPDITGLEASRRILNNAPRMRIIVFSSDTSRALVDEGLIAGVRGYLSKVGFGDELKVAIESVMSGRFYLSPSASDGILNDYRKSLLGKLPTMKPSLSERDKQLLQLIASGRRSKEIGEILGVSTKSIEAYRSRLIKKLGVSNSTELVRYGAEHGLLKA